MNEQRDRAIGLLEEARDGFDSVLDETERGERLADSDSRIRKGMDLVDQAKKVVDLLRDLVEQRRHRMALSIAYSLISAVSDPLTKRDLEKSTEYVSFTIARLGDCNFGESGGHESKRGGGI